ncbi:GlxA family transcriptional regulator [Streptomyces sp. Inha503]|uniref:GlxA family transcriptional regulator n=1 Tax=Streptomyces sp. Inha503 TaxID=3383314 RepID=UPI0039A368AE
MLDGRRATTHWRYADDLARLHPTVEVDPDVLCVDAEGVLTSAGVARASTCACTSRAATTDPPSRTRWHERSSPHRIEEGGQAQFIRRPPAPPKRTSLGPTLEWALTRPDKPLTVAGLAAHARQATRTFVRSFAAETGTTLIKWLNTARVDRARELLETTDATISHVSQMYGLGTPANFRHHFRRTTGITPREYRQSFAVI